MSNIEDRKQRRDRAFALFEKEECAQRNAAAALRQVKNSAAQGQAHVSSGTAIPGSGMEAIVQSVEHDLVTTHAQLREARHLTAELCASDPEMIRLENIVYGSRGSAGNTATGEIIDVTPVDVPDVPTQPMLPRNK